MANPEARRPRQADMAVGPPSDPAAVPKVIPMIPPGSWNHLERGQEHSGEVQGNPVIIPPAPPVQYREPTPAAARESLRIRRVGHHPVLIAPNPVQPWRLLCPGRGIPTRDQVVDRPSGLWMG